MWCGFRRGRRGSRREPRGRPGRRAGLHRRARRPAAGVGGGRMPRERPHGARQGGARGQDAGRGLSCCAAPPPHPRPRRGRRPGVRRGDAHRRTGHRRRRPPADGPVDAVRLDAMVARRRPRRHPLHPRRCRHRPIWSAGSATSPRRRRCGSTTTSRSPASPRPTPPPWCSNSRRGPAQPRPTTSSAGCPASSPTARR